MVDRVAQFLDEYKKLELLCRSKDKEVNELENELGVDRGDPEATKIRMCRQLRNFVVHNEYDGFIVISPGMIKFLKNYTKSLEKSLKVKKGSKKK